MAATATMSVGGLPFENATLNRIDQRRICCSEGIIKGAQHQHYQQPVSQCSTGGWGSSNGRKFGCHPAAGSSFTRSLRPTYGSRPLTRALWNGGEQLVQLQQAVQDLGPDGSAAALSEIGSTIAPAIDAASVVQKTAFFATVAGGWLYVTAYPGILVGAFDTFVVAPFQSAVDLIRGRRSWNAKDFIVGEWIGEGSFGTVYTGARVSKNGNGKDAAMGKRTTRLEELNRDSKFERVVLKKVKVRVEGAEQCAEMEEWFNSRVCRASRGACAEYLGSFISDRTQGQFVQGGKWLVWKYEGTMTLANFMKQPSFPDNLETLVFGSKGVVSEPDSLRRRSILIQTMMRQLLTSVKKLHAIGIVHRDIKPSNLVVTQSGKLKIIDLGAAVDLRTGRNFNPEQGMLDPDYCPPELFVLPEQTPKPPIAPLAAMLSPFLCVLNSPDLFDTYSVGVILMQLACTSLRTPIGLQTFKNEMEDAGYDLDKWRRTTKVKGAFEVLDLDGGKAWDLARKLLCKRGLFKRGRLSAAAALRHRYFRFGRDQVASVLSNITPAKKQKA